MKKYLIIILMILSLGVTACSNTNVSNNKTDSINTPNTQIETSNTSGYTKITPEDAKKRLDNEKGIILLDVREQDEYVEGHIKNSTLLPVDSIEADTASKLTDKNATIFVYCRSGRRSAIASDTLVKLGYTKVYDLGGIIDWPYEIVKDK